MTKFVNVHTYPRLKKSVFVTFWGTHVTCLEYGFHWARVHNKYRRAQPRQPDGHQFVVKFLYILDARVYIRLRIFCLQIIKWRHKIFARTWDLGTNYCIDYQLMLCRACAPVQIRQCLQLAYLASRDASMGTVTSASFEKSEIQKQIFVFYYDLLRNKEQLA